MTLYNVCKQILYIFFDLITHPLCCADIIHGNLPTEEDAAADRIAFTTRRLLRAGYCRYEISNFARPGHASRHNRVYWSGAGWWAFGLGATSAPWGERMARPRTREAYASWLKDQRQALDSSFSRGPRLKGPLLQADSSTFKETLSCTLSQSIKNLKNLSTFKCRLDGVPSLMTSKRI